VLACSLARTLARSHACARTVVAASARVRDGAAPAVVERPVGEELARHLARLQGRKAADGEALVLFAIEGQDREVLGAELRERARLRPERNLVERAAQRALGLARAAAELEARAAGGLSRGVHLEPAADGRLVDDGAVEDEPHDLGSKHERDRAPLVRG
jgi:hypothetical protein